jgi:hypothetical protein
MNAKKLLLATCLLMGASAFAQGTPARGKPTDTGAARATDAQGPKADRGKGHVPTIPENAAPNPNAPPPHVLEKLREMGHSMTAIGVHEQLADKPISGR